MLPKWIVSSFLENGSRFDACLIMKSIALKARRGTMQSKKMKKTMNMNNSEVSLITLMGTVDSDYYLAQEIVNLPQAKINQSAFM
jgi:hypothetical protein